MARLKLPDDAEITREQAEVVAEAVAGRRGKVPAPMIAWLRNPELARRGQKLGELLRFETTLAPHLSELAILVSARHWSAHHEWSAHKTLALAAGLDPRTVADIAARRPPYLRDEREDTVFAVSATLLASARLPAALYRRAEAVLGERGLVELVGILGYYSLVALTLNAFELGLPENAAPELEDPAFPGAGADA
ncbi:carboxymuconolactone decarboxylase family protein [Pseudochelatococcus sp. B33]